MNYTDDEELRKAVAADDAADKQLASEQQQNELSVEENEALKENAKEDSQVSGDAITGMAADGGVASVGLAMLDELSGDRAREDKKNNEAKEDQKKGGFSHHHKISKNTVGHVSLEDDSKDKKDLGKKAKPKTAEELRNEFNLKNRKLLEQAQQKMAEIAIARRAAEISEQLKKKREKELEDPTKQSLKAQPSRQAAQHPNYLDPMKLGMDPLSRNSSSSKDGEKA